MLTHTFDRSDLADQISQSVDAVIDSGTVTPDLGGNATTNQVTNAIIQQIYERRHNYVENDVR